MQCTDAQQKVNEYFESSSEYWKNIYFDNTLLPTFYQDRHNATLSWISQLRLPSDARILEAGCGAGLLTIALARDGYRVDTLDSTATMLQMTRKEAQNQGVQDRVRLHAADVHALAFAPGMFDLVIAIGVIPWLHSERAALAEMHRVLKPGGYLIVTADNNARLNRILDPLLSPALTPLRAAAKCVLRLCGAWSPDPGFQPKRHYPHEVRRLIRSCNFREIDSCTIGFGPFTLFRKNLLTDASGVAAHRRLQALAQKGVRPLCRMGSHYMVLARAVPYRNDQRCP